MIKINRKLYSIVVVLHQDVVDCLLPIPAAHNIVARRQCIMMCCHAPTLISSPAKSLQRLSFSPSFRWQDGEYFHFYVYVNIRQNSPKRARQLFDLTIAFLSLSVFATPTIMTLQWTQKILSFSLL
jgi:hypothetical protein